jgi:Bacterial regulatory proteins, luxR family
MSAPVWVRKKQEGEGRTNKEIAIKLATAPETIKTHLKRIFLKLGTRSRAEAVVLAQRLALPVNTCFPGSGQLGYDCLQRHALVACWQFAEPRAPNKFQC